MGLDQDTYHYGHAPRRTGSTSSGVYHTIEETAMIGNSVKHPVDGSTGDSGHAGSITSSVGTGSDSDMRREDEAHTYLDILDETSDVGESVDGDSARLQRGDSGIGDDYTVPASIARTTAHDPYATLNTTDAEKDGSQNLNGANGTANARNDESQGNRSQAEQDSRDDYTRPEPREQNTTPNPYATLNKPLGVTQSNASSAEKTESDLNPSDGTDNKAFEGDNESEDEAKCPDKEALKEVPVVEVENEVYAGVGDTGNNDEGE